MAAAAGGAGAEAAEGGKPLFPFVFVGCWNQPGIEEGAHDNATSRNAVAATVATQADIQHIVLGGDNVYPRPKPDGSKNKKHELGVFKTGIELYRATGKNIIGSFGNHNIDTLGHQMTEFKLTNTYYDRTFDDNIRLVVLNTNIIINKKKKPADYAGMLCWFDATVEQIRSKGHRYFVVQHEPYFTARAKGFGAMEDGEAFLDVMIKHVPIAILCADTHHYQHAIIRLTGAADSPIIHQYIVGTGGANRDAYMDGFREQSFGKYVFTNVEEVPIRAGGLSSFGFLRVNGPNIDAIQFIPVETPQDGGRRRTSRRLNKKKRRSKSRRGTRRYK